MANKYRSVLASGGGVQPTGNAVPADVLAGKTFSNADGIDKTGTMVNRGAVSETLAAGESYTVPEGYHNGSGVVSANAADYTPKFVNNFANMVSAAQTISGLSIGKHQMFMSGTLTNITSPVAPTADTISGATLEFKEYVNDSSNSMTVLRYEIDVTSSTVSLKLTTGSFNGTTGIGYTLFII